MTSRPMKRSSPSLRWRTLSSTGPRGSSPIRKSYEQERFSDNSHLHYAEEQSYRRPSDFPDISKRGDFNFPSSSMDYKSRVQSNNSKTVSKSYWKYSRSNIIRSAFPRKRYTLANSGGNDSEFHGLKRTTSHELDSFPVKRPKQQFDQKCKPPHHARSPPPNDSAGRRYSTGDRRSREEYRPVPRGNAYGFSHASRDSTRTLQTSESSKGPGPEQSRRTSAHGADKQQHPASWEHRFSDDDKGKFYDGRNDVLRDTQRMKKGPTLNPTNLHDNQKFSGRLNRIRGRISKDVQASPLLHNRKSKERINFRKQDQGLQDGKQAMRFSHRSRRESELKSQQKHENEEHLSRGRRSGDPTKETKCSNAKTYDRDDVSWVTLNRQSSSRSLSSDSKDSFSDNKVSNRGHSRGSNRSAKSLGTDAATNVKGQAVEFRPDYVVIVRRKNEGERPLCLREEFSEKSPKPATNNEQNIKRKDVRSSERESTSETTLHTRKSDVEAGRRASGRGSSAHSSKEKIGPEITSDLDEKTSSCGRSSSDGYDAVSVASVKTEEGRRSATPDRIGSQNNSSGTNPQEIGLTSETVKDPAPSSAKKNAFDLRQKIAERRLQRFGKVNTPRIVQRFPNQSESLDEPMPHVSSVENSSQHQNYSTKKPFYRHSFFRQKTEPRRSVIFRQPR